MLAKIYTEHFGESLSTAGSDLVGVCPFHNDTKPSFSLNDHKDVYICFACGARGGLINFVSNMLRVNDSDAIVWLEKNYQMDFSRDIRYLMGVLPKKLSSKYNNMEQAKWMDSRYTRGNARFASRKMLEKINHRYAKILLKKMDAHEGLFDGLFVLYFGIAGGEATVIYARLFGKDIKYFEMYNAGGVYGNLEPVCYLVEGFSDCDAIAYHGKNAVSMNGLVFGSINANIIQRAIIWVDGDEAGKNFLLKLKDKEPKFIVDVIWTEGYDPNEYMCEHKEIPQEISYMEWWVTHGVATNYSISEMILSQPNLCNTQVIDSIFCARHKLNSNILEHHIDTAKLRNRNLALQVANSDYTGTLPKDFFGFPDIDDFYLMRQNDRAGSMLKYSHLIQSQSVVTEDALSLLVRLYQARVLRQNIPNIMNGRTSVEELIYTGARDTKTTLLEAYKNNLDVDRVIIPFFSDKLRERYKGLYAGKLLMIGGISGSNKTTFCINLLHGLCESGKSSMYFNNDMREYEMVNRLLAIKCNRALSDMKESDWEFVKQHDKYLSHVHIDNNMDFENIRSNMAGYDVVFIDYIQGMDGSGKGEENYQFLTNATKQLKKLAVQHGIAIVIACQYNSGKQFDANYYDKVAGAKGIMNDMDLSLYIQKHDQGQERTLKVNKCRYAEDNVEIRMRLNNLNLKLTEVESS